MASTKPKSLKKCAHCKGPLLQVPSTNGEIIYIVCPCGESNAVKMKKQVIGTLELMERASKDSRF